MANSAISASAKSRQPKSTRRKIVPIVSVQNRYSLADRRHEETLSWCEQHNIAFLPWYPMAGGKLLKPDHPFSQKLAQLATRYDATPAQLSISWLLHRSPVMLPIPGTSQVKHLEENIAAASLQIGPDEWAQLEEAPSNLPEAITSRPRPSRPSSR